MHHAQCMTIMQEGGGGGGGGRGRGRGREAAEQDKTKDHSQRFGNKHYNSATLPVLHSLQPLAHANKALHEPVAVKVPSALHAPGLVQVKPLSATIAQLVPTATVVAPLPQFNPVQLLAPWAIVGTVHVTA